MARYNAPESSRCQPSASATARLIVPLPEPEGPSMVSTGTADFPSIFMRQHFGLGARPGIVAPPRSRRPVLATTPVRAHLVPSQASRVVASDRAIEGHQRRIEQDCMRDDQTIERIARERESERFADHVGEAVTGDRDVEFAREILRNMAPAMA